MLDPADRSEHAIAVPSRAGVPQFFITQLSFRLLESRVLAVAG